MQGEDQDCTYLTFGEDTHLMMHVCVCVYLTLRADMCLLNDRVIDVQCGWLLGFLAECVPAAVGGQGRLYVL